MKVLTRKGALVEDTPENLYLADTEHDPALAPLHAAASTYRIALGPRAGQKVLTWKDPPWHSRAKRHRTLPRAVSAPRALALTQFFGGEK